jgi:hypothetical protein
LGTPQFLTDPDQIIAWQADYEPFGKTTVVTEAVVNNLRLPGQYFDEETGLHYNFTLRGIKDSPLYLHDGRALTLEDTVEFFNLVMQLKLTPKEEQKLVAFMRQLWHQWPKPFEERPCPHSIRRLCISPSRSWPSQSSPISSLTSKTANHLTAQSADGLAVAFTLGAFLLVIGTRARRISQVPRDEKAVKGHTG